MNSKKESNGTENKSIECAICKNHHPFDIPTELMEALREKRLVIFAGAGISTEGKLVFPFTLYDDVRGELGLTEDDRPPFSVLMENYSK